MCNGIGHIERVQQPNLQCIQVEVLDTKLSYLLSKFDANIKGTAYPGWYRTVLLSA